jgi:hypothetical protein
VPNIKGEVQKGTKETINLLLKNGEPIPIPFGRYIYVEIGDGKHIVSGWSHDIFADQGKRE